MAAVYRACDTRIGREVALKVLGASPLDAPALDRFQREARIAGSLSHPNVVALYDVGFENGTPFIVTELLQGQTLRERLSEGPIPTATTLDWGIQIARGLAAAHARGIIHRDLKPANVFLSADGHVKLLDFGIAKLREPEGVERERELMEETLTPFGGNTASGVVMGTPGYMSPEQVRGEPVDARTDCFSFGAVLYEMLTGRRAFAGATFVEASYAILHSEPGPLPENLPPQLAQVVRRCLEKDVRRRFQSAEDLAFNLELLRNPTGTGRAEATGAKPRNRALAWRRPILITGALLFLMAAAAALAARSLSRTPPPSVEQITFRQGRISAARFTPEGRVIYSAGWNGDPLEVFARAPGSPDAQSSGIRDAELLAVSARGELAILLRTTWYGPWRRGTLAVAPAAGGTPRELVADVVYADWTPGGDLIAVRNLGGKRQLEWPLGRAILDTPGYFINPRVSPDGQRLALLHESPAGATDLRIVDREGKERMRADIPATSASLRRNFSAQDESGLAWLPSGQEVWFTTENAIWASTTSGKTRLIYQGVYPMRLEDVSTRGTVLVNTRSSRREVAFLPPGQQRERGLSWQAWDHLAALSDDGSQVLFSTSYADETYAYLRPTDGAPPVRLGSGEPFALSPDARWVLSRSNDAPDSLSIFPVGVGQTRTLSVPGLFVLRARWLQDGKRLVLLAREGTDTGLRFYLMPVGGGTPKRVSETLIRPFYFEVSRDDRWVAARALDDAVTLFPIDGGASVTLNELPPQMVPFGWDREGRLWVRSFRDLPARVLRVNVESQRILEERRLSPGDPTGLTVISQAFITPDGKAMAFDYVRTLGSLFLLNSLANDQR
jgi:hypothetical protein